MACQLSGQVAPTKETYRKEEINNIHDDEDEVSDTGVVVGVAGKDESGSNDVVSEHLPMVLTALFNVNDNHLLQPESPLAKKVGLHDSIELAVGPISPEVLHAHVVRRGAVNVLHQC